MAKQSGGLALLFDKATSAECPTCEAPDPDPQLRGYCNTCGALFRDRIRLNSRLAQTALLLGVGATAVGALLTLGFSLGWIGLLVFLLGLAGLGYGAYALHRHATSLLAALSLRTAPETLRLLSRTDRLSASLLFLFAVIFVACIPYYLYVERPRQRLDAYQEAFAASVPEYLSMVPPDTPIADDAEPKLLGKAVVVDKQAEGGGVSAVHGQLPEEIRAESPTEVGTVVWIDWKEFQYGRYSATRVGYRIDAVVTVIDKANKAVLDRVEFEGGLPPETAPSGSQHGYGPRPVEQILEYLSNLPRAPAAPAAPAPAAPAPSAPAPDQPENEPAEA